MIKKAIKRGINVTCEVAPHHLSLREEDSATVGRSWANIKPNLVSSRGQQALWDNLRVIDVFATDHALHLVSKKDTENGPGSGDNVAIAADSRQAGSSHSGRSHSHIFFKKNA